MRYLYILTFLFITHFLNASNTDPVKYGQLSEYEMNLKNYGDAEAVILCDYGRYYFDAPIGNLYFYYKRHLRIKILKPEGLKYAKLEFPFYDLKKASFFKNSTVYNIKAQTLNIDADGKISKTKLKAKNRTEGEADEAFNNLVEVTFPNVKVGSIVEIQIEIPTIEVVNPPEWYLQYNIPVLHSELRVQSPISINYGAKLYNSDFLDVSETNSMLGSVQYPLSNRRYRYPAYDYSALRSGLYSYPSNEIRIVKKYIPAAKDDVPKDQRMFIKLMLEFASMKYYLPGMEELFKSTDPLYKYKDRSEKQTALSNTSFILYRRPNLEELGQDLMKNPEFGPPLMMHLEIMDTINDITDSDITEIEKISKITEFVGNHMDWDSTCRIFVNPAFPKIMLKILSKVNYDNEKINRSLYKPLEKQIGSNAEINFILINILRKKGFNAYPVLTSTKDFSTLDPDFFCLHQFNHVVVMVEYEGKNLFFDAVRTENKSFMEIENINQIGLVINKDGAFWISFSESYSNPVLKEI